MAALPYMQLYVADYLADTADLSAMEHGAYLMLIMNYWQRGKPLPTDERKLAKIAKCSPAEWQEVRESMAGFFERTETEWRHKRIENELRKVSERSAKARANAQRALSGRSAGAERVQSDSQAGDQRQPSYTDTDTDTEKEADKINQSLIESDTAREPDATVTALPTPDPFLRFPSDGSIAYTAWADVTRRCCPGADVDLVASRFRGFCHATLIAFDRSGILRTYESFCRTHAKKRGTA